MPTTAKSSASSPPRFDDIDWDDEVRIFLEERASFSADGAHRHGGEPALRRAGDHGNQDLRPPHGLAELDLPAPNAAGAEGALKRYGTGAKAEFDRRRVMPPRPLSRERVGVRVDATPQPGSALREPSPATGRSTKRSER